MASIINATVTSPGGLVTTGDNTNELKIQTGETDAVTVSSSQVVTFNNPIVVGTNAINAENSLGFRNRIINGDMRIDQRNAGAAVTASGDYPVDRFVMSNATDGAFSAQQVAKADNAGNAPDGFVNSTKITTTTADGTLTTTQNIQFLQRIEGTNVADLGWGTASAKTVTLSFWVRSSLTGTFGGAFRNSAFDRSYAFTYTISAADTWEYKTVTIPGDTSGTWLTTTSTGIILNFGLGAGPDRSGTAGSWAGANYVQPTGTVSVIGTLNATWYITGVQLEVGSVATPFERRPYGTELALCERYYEKSYAVSVAPGTITTNNGWAFYFAATGASAGGFSCTWRTRKRAAPTVVVYSTITGASGQINAAGTDVSATISQPSEVSAFIYSGSSSNNYWHTTASAEL